MALLKLHQSAFPHVLFLYVIKQTGFTFYMIITQAFILYFSQYPRIRFFFILHNRNTVAYANIKERSKIAPLFYLSVPIIQYSTLSSFFSHMRKADKASLCNIWVEGILLSSGFSSICSYINESSKPIFLASSLQHP